MELHEKLKEVILTEDLMKLAPEGTDKIEVSVDIPYDEYREAHRLLTVKERMLGMSLYLLIVPFNDSLCPIEYLYVRETHCF